MKSLFAITFLLCISMGFAIRCQICSSDTSMNDCKAKEEEHDCGGSFDRCAKMTLDFKVSGFHTKMYAKSCATKSLCEDSNQQLDNCKKIDGSTCELDCCDSDGCNSGAAPVVSVFLMLSCAIMALYR